MKLAFSLFVRFLLLIWLVSSLNSCDFISNKNRVSETEELVPIDFSSVDAYPLLQECAHLSSRKAQQECFYEQLSKKIETALGEKDILLNNTVIDTIQVKINVNSKGKISVTSTSISNITELSALKKAIFESIESLPRTQPAIKSGIPINSTYVLPIVVHNNEVEE